jgi:di/tricarboxylate transporter
MTLNQALAFAIILGTMGLLIWDRIRYDLVALLALLTSIACGIVKPGEAFRGFSDDIVIIVGSALVVSAAIGRSGLVETLMKPLVPRMRTSGMQVAVLASAVTALSAFMKNIGALAIFIPIALQVARRTEKPASRVLMPLASGSLLGGIITLIGTSPNIIVSRMREQITGEPFRMFDFAPVGVCLAVAGVAFLTVGWRLLPKIKQGTGATPETRFSIEDYMTEVRLPAASPCIGKTVRELETLGDGDVTVAAIIREGYRRYVPAGYWQLFEGDILVLEADTHALSRLVNAAKLELIHGKELALGDARPEDLTVVEAVVTANSPMIGSTVEQLALRERYGLNLLALSRSGRRIAQRLRRVRFQDGDLLVLQGRADRTNDKLAALGCLPLAERNVPLGRPRNLYLPAVILGVAMVLVTTGVVSVPVGFFGAAVAVLLFQLLTLQEAYDAVEWPVLILLGALIPVSEALQTTGATELVAGWLSGAAQHLPALGGLGLTLLAAMALTPFLNNAATVLVMAPIAASLAAKLALSPDPFLMAVATGAACDFLTPIGHQCNTLVMGPGGYRFGDYWRLGLPLSLIVALLGTLLISWFWPLRSM